MVLWRTVREPRRGAIEGAASDEEPPSLAETLRFLGRIPSFRHVVLAASLNAFVIWALLSWAAAAMMRGHGLSTTEVGARLAISMSLSSALGLIAAGYLADRLGRRDARWYLWLPAAASVGAIPFVVAFLLWPDPAQAFWLVVPGAFLNTMWVGTYNAVVQSLAKPRMRAMASAMNTLISTGLIGQGLGPLLVGILSDRLEPSYGKDALRVALAVAVFAHLWGAIHNLLASRTLRADQRARQA